MPQRGCSVDRQIELRSNSNGLIERRLFQVPGRGLLVGVGDTEEGFFAKRFAQELQADG